MKIRRKLEEIRVVLINSNFSEIRSSEFADVQVLQALKGIQTQPLDLAISLKRTTRKRSQDLNRRMENLEHPLLIC